MNAIPFVGKKTGKTYFKFSLEEQEYHALRDDNGGACIRCGAETYGVEPDARKYKCEVCENLGVYGIEELLIMGYIDVLEET